MSVFQRMLNTQALMFIYAITGIIMARKLGAVLYPYQHKMSGIFAPDPYDMPVVGQPSNSYPFNCLLVTSKGERKVSETAGSHFQTEYFIEANAPDFGWVVMDQAIADRFLNLDKYLQATKQGSPYLEAYKENSLEALAKDMKTDAKTLIATVERYNELCKAGKKVSAFQTDFYLSFGTPEEYALAQHNINFLSELNKKFDD